MFTRILVPTDSSPPSDAALAYATALSAAFGASLRPLHAATADPADAIVACAGTTGIDLIVMGTHGREGLAHLMIGSVAEKVVRTAPCPVLTVHRPPRGAGVRFRRILVPTDFSDASDGALDCARLMAASFSASIHLLHVLEDLRVDGPLGAEVFVSETPETRTARLKDARERLSHRLTADDRRDRQATCEVIFGHCAGVIAEYAEDNGFDLIVMGTHGRTGLRHLIMGSVAERVVQHATCPVLTTRIPCAQLEPAALMPPELRASV